MPPRDDLEDMQADLDKRLSVHEAICAERYGKIVAGLEEMKAIVAEQGRSLAALAAKMTERAGSGRAVREVVAYLVAIAGIVAALFSGGLVHPGK
jgi:hypothetical protein